eukprot:6069849-Prymnesium_polylepis.1
MELYRCVVFCSDRPVALEPWSTSSGLHPLLSRELTPAICEEAYWATMYPLQSPIRKRVVATYTPRLARGAVGKAPPLFDLGAMSATLLFYHVLVAGEPVSVRSASF